MQFLLTNCCSFEWTTARLPQVLSELPPASQKFYIMLAKRFEGRRESIVKIRENAQQYVVLC